MDGPYTVSVEFDDVAAEKENDYIDSVSRTLGKAGESGEAKGAENSTFSWEEEDYGNHVAADIAGEKQVDVHDTEEIPAQQPRVQVQRLISSGDSIRRLPSTRDKENEVTNKTAGCFLTWLVVINTALLIGVIVTGVFFILRQTETNNEQTTTNQEQAKSNRKLLSLLDEQAKTIDKVSAMLDEQLEINKQAMSLLNMSKALEELGNQNSAKSKELSANLSSSIEDKVGKLADKLNVAVHDRIAALTEKINVTISELEFKITSLDETVADLDYRMRDKTSTLENSMQMIIWGPTSPQQLDGIAALNATITTLSDRLNVTVDSMHARIASLNNTVRNLTTTNIKQISMLERMLFWRNILLPVITITSSYSKLCPPGTSLTEQQCKSSAVMDALKQIAAGHGLLQSGADYRFVARVLDDRGNPGCMVHVRDGRVYFNDRTDGRNAYSFYRSVCKVFQLE